VWQQDVTLPPSANPGAGPGRGVPDVAGNADSDTGYEIVVDGISTVVGGTSAVAPLWAGLLARAVQGGVPRGFPNPALYAAPERVTFREITAGSNGGTRRVPGGTPAVDWAAHGARRSSRPFGPTPPRLRRRQSRCARVAPRVLCDRLVVQAIVAAAGRGPRAGQSIARVGRLTPAPSAAPRKRRPCRTAPGGFPVAGKPHLRRPARLAKRLVLPADSQLARPATKLLATTPDSLAEDRDRPSPPCCRRTVRACAAPVRAPVDATV